MDPNTVALAQRWVGPDDKITDMSAFYDALVKALVDAHAEGEDEGEDEAAAEMEIDGQGFTENKQLIVPFLIRGFRDGLIVEATFGNAS